MSYHTDHILSVSGMKCIAYHRWKDVTLESELPYLFVPEPITPKSPKRHIDIHFADNVDVRSCCFGVSHDGKWILSCGYWDNSFVCSSVESGKVVQHISQHKDVVTCLSLDWIKTARWTNSLLATGSKDTTVMIWQFKNNDERSPIDIDCKHVLAGHDSEVTCVCLSVDLGVVVSASLDGTCIVNGCDS
eukprot:UN25513